MNHPVLVTTVAASAIALAWPAPSFAGAKAPRGDKESNWLPAPDGHFSFYIRSWAPPIIAKVGSAETQGRRQ